MLIPILFILLAIFDIITPYYTHLYFLYFKFNVFPACLEIRKVVLIFKTGSYSEVNHYRPISVFFNFSKIFEKLIVAKLTNFL